MGISMIVFSLILLMFFAYRGYSIIFIAPIFAVVAAIGSGHASMPVYSEIYMTKAAEYIKTYYPVFLLGAVFAKIMEQGGLAAAVADKIVSALGRDKAILAVLLGCGVLTYGGLSVFVVAFVMYPFAAILFKQADIPKRLLPGLLWMGIFTYSMVAIPGTPQIQNIIPTRSSAHRLGPLRCSASSVPCSISDWPGAGSVIATRNSRQRAKAMVITCSMSRRNRGRPCRTGACPRCPCSSSSC